MINIPNNEVKITKARHQFIQKMLPLLTKRIKSYSKPGSKKFLANILTDLNLILSCEPDELVTISAKINAIVNVHSRNKKAVKKIFDYDWFISKTKTRYNAYHLAAALDINVCVYCNRNFTHTVITNEGKKITRPQFDHFFSKVKHPILALSFYNLIPSCSICNAGIKHDADFSLLTHNHPYKDNFINDFSFTYKYTTSTPSGFLIYTETPNIKAHRTLSDLKTDLIYNTHVSELKELLRMKYAFSDKYLQILKNNILTGVNIPRKELYSIAFGVEEKGKDFGTRPFSKFKNDILKELDII